MDWKTLADTLFGTDHGIVQDGDYLQGTVSFEDEPLTVIGTTDHAPIGVRLALTQARAVLDTMARHPGRSILLLIDTQGQQLRRRDELLGINRAMAHLGMTIDLARRRGHRVLGLVYDQALSGGFITSGLIADACDALPEAEIRVMRIPAMARVTKLSEEKLTALSRIEPRVCAGRRQLRRDGRRSQALGGRPARRASRCAGASDRGRPARAGRPVARWPPTCRCRRAACAGGVMSAADAPLHRHQIAWLTDAGWQRVRHRDWDDTARNCLGHWAVHRLPLVVTRQPGGHSPDSIAMGLPAPRRWERRRIALAVERRDVLYFDEFPRAELIERLLPADVRPDWRRLCAALVACGAPARVYGSYGWKHLTGLSHVRPGSDIDVWLSVSDTGQADAVATLLRSFGHARPRLDGELVFGDGTAVAWREWLAWRAGRTSALLVKKLDGSSLVRSPCWRSAAVVADAAS